MAIPYTKSKRATFLPVRVPTDMRYNFFVTIDGEVSDKDFDKLVQLNDEMWFERTAEGTVEVMPPPKSLTGVICSKTTAQLLVWADEDETGVTFSSITGFKLPNSAIRSPKASWVRRSRLAALSQEQKEDYLPLCPDFVLELRSATDRINRLKEKMEEYMANGAQLGWLIDPEERRVYVYRPNAEVEILENPVSVSGESVLPGFALKLGKIFDSDF
ncbi:MAG: Uma2 family endonuclease [Acidobacteriota bacterium]|nr:Uma2 family endonuclease [Acidobacteriota bacterium]